MDCHAAGPGSIPGLCSFFFPFEAVLFIHKKYYFLLVNRLADMATPDAAVREVPGSNPVHENMKDLEV